MGMSNESGSATRAKFGATPAEAVTSWAASLGVDFSLVSEEATEYAPTVPATATQTEARPSLESVLAKLMSFDGAIGVALVDSESGMVLSAAGTASNLGLSAAGAAVILRSRLATNKALGLAERIDDVLISLGNQVQIIHPLAHNPKFFVYMIGDKTTTGLAMARYKAAEADSQLRF
jgi:predicted regulator of Ras-like GTPase activity (Roadblock/LC7/MglB family)